MYKPPRTAGATSNSKSLAGAMLLATSPIRAELHIRLGGADWIDDTEFAACALDDQAILALRQWAQTWADDIAERLVEQEDPHED